MSIIIDLISYEHYYTLTLPYTLWPRADPTLAGEAEPIGRAIGRANGLSASLSPRLMGQDL
jgi:hypothetical protein